MCYRIVSIAKGSREETSIIFSTWNNPNIIISNITTVIDEGVIVKETSKL